MIELFENLQLLNESKNTVSVDYETGEKLFNKILNYLISKNLVGRNNTDFNWQPSEFNAENLEADGEIYLINDCYFLFYPYINKYSDNEFRIIVINSYDLEDEHKNKIMKIFDQYKSDNWNIIFELN